MTITFENDNHIIVYALKMIISFARDNQYIFLAESIWWIASVIGRQQGLIVHIDNLWSRGTKTIQEELRILQGSKEDSDLEYLPTQVHPDQILQVSNERAISAMP